MANSPQKKARFDKDEPNRIEEEKDNQVMIHTTKP
jgi:hypothetical protein